MSNYVSKSYSNGMTLEASDMNNIIAGIDDLYGNKLILKETIQTEASVSKNLYWELDLEESATYNIKVEWKDIPTVSVTGTTMAWKIQTVTDTSFTGNGNVIYRAALTDGEAAQSIDMNYTHNGSYPVLNFYYQYLSATNEVTITIMKMNSSSSSDSAHKYNNLYYGYAPVDLKPQQEFSFSYKPLITVDGGGRNLQGFDIFNEVIFQCCDAGWCRTYNLNTGELIADFALGSNVASNHAGGVNFGLEYPEGSEYPALYVSGDLTTKDCYVEKVTTTSAELIQTIHFNLDNNSTFNGAQIILDKDRKRLLYQQRELTSIGDVNNVFHIYEFEIPPLGESEVTLTREDVLKEYTFPHYSTYYQGACIFNKQFIQTHGYATDITGYKVGLLFFNMDSSDNHDLRCRLIFDNLINYEPQGITVYKNRLIMSFVNSTYYEIFVGK